MYRRRTRRRLLAFALLTCILGGMVTVGAAAQATEPAPETGLTLFIDWLSSWVDDVTETMQSMGFSIEPNG